MQKQLGNQFMLTQITSGNDVNRESALHLASLVKVQYDHQLARVVSMAHVFACLHKNQPKQIQMPSKIYPEDFIEEVQLRVQRHPKTLKQTEHVVSWRFCTVSSSRQDYFMAATSQIIATKPRGSPEA